MSHIDVQVQVTGTDGSVLNGPQVPANSDLQCGVAPTGSKLLTGSLLGLPGALVPLTSGR